MRPHGSNTSDVYQRVTDFAMRRLDLIQRGGGIYEFTQILDDKTILTWATRMPSLRSEISQHQTSIMGQIVLPSQFKLFVWFEVAELPRENGQRPLYLQISQDDYLKQYLLWINQDEDLTLLVSAGCFNSEEILSSMDRRAKLMITMASLIAKEVLRLQPRTAEFEDDKGVIWN